MRPSTVVRNTEPVPNTPREVPDLPPVDMDGSLEYSEKFKDGVELFQKKNFKEAAEFFENTLALNPTNIPLQISGHKNLIVTYYLLKDYANYENHLVLYIKFMNELHQQSRPEKYD